MCGHCLLGQFHRQKQSDESVESFMEEVKNLCYNTPGCGMFYVEVDKHNGRQDAFLCSDSTPVTRMLGATTYLMSK